MESSLFQPSMYVIKGILIMDNDGNRLWGKYYDPNILPTAKEQKAFEKTLFQKTHRANSEIIMLDGMICLYRSNVDLLFYVIGSSSENELMLLSVLNCLHDSISLILKKNVEKRVLLDNMENVILAVDEICDGGIILESEPSNVFSRVVVNPEDALLGEQTTVAQVFQSAKEQLKWSLLK